MNALTPGQVYFLSTLCGLDHERGMALAMQAKRVDMTDWIGPLLGATWGAPEIRVARILDTGEVEHFDARGHYCAEAAAATHRLIRPKLRLVKP